MKRQLSARTVAKKMAEIMMDHLDSFPEKERKDRIEEGRKVLKAKAKSSLGSSGNCSKVSSSDGTSRFPLLYSKKGFEFFRITFL